jgi:hypothetical protein
MRARGLGWLPVMGLTVCVAVAGHVPAMAQMGARTTLGGALEPELLTDRIAVPFAGTYAVTLSLGRDTAQLFFRTAAEAELRTVIAPDQRIGSGPGATAIPGLSLLVYADPDIEALPYSEDVAGRVNGALVAPIDPETAAGGSWVITLMVGVDTVGDTPAARLSRLLLEVRAQRALLEQRCSEDPVAANRAAARVRQASVCDDETGLPLSPRLIPGDGMLLVGVDDGVRVMQRVGTPEGELTLSGKRVSRTTLIRGS